MCPSRQLITEREPCTRVYIYINMVVGLYRNQTVERQQTRMDIFEETARPSKLKFSSSVVIQKHLVGPGPVVRALQIRLRSAKLYRIYNPFTRFIVPDVDLN